MNGNVERLWNAIQTVRKPPLPEDMQQRQTTMEDTTSISLISKYCESPEQLSELLMFNSGLVRWLEGLTDKELVFTLWLAWPKLAARR